MKDDIDLILDQMLDLALMISIFKNEFYGENCFKVNAFTGEISERQHQILMALKFFDTNSVSEIAKSLHISNSNFSILASKLIEQGYLKKKYPEYTEDKRKVHFQITEKGESFLEAFNESVITEIEQFYLSLTPSQRALFNESLNTLATISPNYDDSWLLV